MASVERTGYPRSKRIVSQRELCEFFTPSTENVAWARERTHGQPERVLALLLLLKSCVCLGYFPELAEVPDAVVAHVRAGAVPEATAVVDRVRTAKRYRGWVRQRLGLVRDPGRAREIAETAMTTAAGMKAHTADLVNVALEEIVRVGLEPPGFTTLDKTAARVGARVEGEVSARGTWRG
ncbi:DUF4158 domain-containing protein [Streptomyces olivoreticuli]